MGRRLSESAARITLTAVALTATALIWSSDHVVAQTRLPSGLLRVVDVEINPGSLSAWTMLHREEILPAQKKGGVPWLDVWASTAAGNPYMRTLVSPISSLADLDRPGGLQRALGVEAAESLLERNRELVNGVHSYIMRARPDLGFGIAPTKRGIGVITTVSVHAGRTAEFEKALKESVVESLKASNVTTYLVLQVMYGGDPNQYRTVLFFPNYEEAASAQRGSSGHPDPLAWLEGSHGPQGVERLAGERGSPIARVERTIIRYLPELSYRPAESE
jgi:hypothetical protein